VNNPKIFLRVYGKMNINGTSVFVPLNEFPILNHVAIAEIERLQFELVIEIPQGTCANSIETLVLPPIEESFSLRIRGNANIPMSYQKLVAQVENPHT
jgi:hypothetical protein